jgi:hypothetical protein
MDPLRSSVARTIARVVAVALALGVLLWLVVRAQRDANESATNVPASDAANDPSRIVTLPASKAGVIDPADARQDPSLLFGSKSGPVPEAVQPASATKKQ